MSVLSRSLLLLIAVALTTGQAPQSSPSVRAILFFSPSCPHCHDVIQESLPPIVDRYGESLMILAINTQSADGLRLFREAGRLYGIPERELGVPLLAVGDRALIGSYDIPNELPGIVDAGLAAGGIPWPEISGLREVLVAAGVEAAEATPPDEEVRMAEAGASPGQGEVGAEPQVGNPGHEPAEAVAEPGPEPEAVAEAGPETVPETVPEYEPETVAEATPDPADTGREAGSARPEAPRADGTPVEAPVVEAPRTEGPGPDDLLVGLEGLDAESLALSPWDRFGQDPAGNTIAVLALLVMLTSLVAVPLLAARRVTLPHWPGWLVGLIVVAGLVTAGYLSYVEVTQAEAVCGPVGDCNTVQQSPYARLFGFLPVGVLGFYGYAVLGLGWLLRGRGPHRWNAVVALGLWLGAALGTLFSAYLTVLEPFVIGATCMWCVTSALLMTMLLWAATPAAVDAWEGFRADTARSSGGGEPASSPGV